MSNSEISFFVDTLLVETILGDPRLYKKAGFVSDLLSKVKGYFASKIDPNNPTESVLNELAPGVLWVLFKSMGIGGWGTLISLLMSVFHVNVYGMLSSLYNKVKSMISGGQKVSSGEIDQAVNSTIQEHTATEVSPQEAQEGYQKLQEMQSKEQQADDGRVYSSLELMHDARIVRLALIEYEDQLLRLTAAPRAASFLSSFTGTRAKGANLLGRIFGWVFKIALASAGLMVAGDVINKFMGRPNSLDGTYQAGKEQPVSSTPAGPAGPTQTKYTLKGDAPLPRTVPMVNNANNIDNMLVQFAQDTYSGLDGKESLIRNTPGFQVIKEKISWYNSDHPGSSQTFIPPIFTSKKQLVDYFIDDVAKADQ